jgi:RHS repeat-associated protein
VPSNQVIDYGYDAVYQLTSEVVRVSTGSTTTNSWSYDAAGNVKTATDAFGPVEASVNADNELTQWSRSPTRMTVTGQVQPGVASNRWYGTTATARGKSAAVSATDGSFAIPGVPLTTGTGSSALTVTVSDVSGNIGTQIVQYTQLPPPTTTFAYDANGNMTNSSAGVSPVFSYQYDAENRLVRALSNGVAVLECWYDGAGHRIAKREVIGTQTNTWQYIWDGWNLVAVLGVDGKLKEFYTRGVGIAGDIGTLVAVRHWTNVISGPLYYLHNNHRGDVIMARQGTATVATLDYAPYGETRSQSGSYTPRFRFSSKEYDASTGFYHFPYRYYAPMWARWMTRDPIGGADGDLNLYRYVWNAPIDVADSLGLMAKPPKKPKTPPVPITPPPCAPLPPTDDSSYVSKCQDCCDYMCSKLPCPNECTKKCYDACLDLKPPDFTGGFSPDTKPGYSPGPAPKYGPTTPVTPKTPPTPIHYPTKDPWR